MATLESNLVAGRPVSALLPSDPMAQLAEQDPVLHGFLVGEEERQRRTLSMVASASVADATVLACAGAAVGNVTTEGYPGARFHAGCGIADEIENVAIERAKRLFGARYANVQPHSCSTANQIVMTALLGPGATILGLDLRSGGHLTHGARVSFSGHYFQAVSYGLDATGWIDHAEVERLAEQHRPGMIICGASSYPRRIDFERFRRIADAVGALLVADISHIAGLVVAGLHPSPVDVAHVTTTSTYKQMFGPRGGLILMGEAADLPDRSGKGTLRDAIQRGVFPFFQGTPNLAAIAAKARAFDWLAGPAFAGVARRIVDGATTLAGYFASAGYEVLTGGTDNHMVMIRLPDRITGVAAERVLEQCGIIINKNVVPGDRRPPTVCSGIRLGTNVLAYRGLERGDVRRCGELIHRVLAALGPAPGDDRLRLPDAVLRETREAVEAICTRFPLVTGALPWA